MPDMLLPEGSDAPITFGNALPPKEAMQRRIEEAGGIQKYAGSNLANTPFYKEGQASSVNTIYTNPMWFSPLHTPQNWQIASRRREVMQWCRFFAMSEPKVAAGISFYSEFPVGSFELVWEHGTGEKKLLKFYENEVKRLGLANILKQIALEYFIIGDVFVHAEIQCEKCGGNPINPITGEHCNHPGGTISKLKILNPDFIEVIDNVLADEPQIFLVPDEQITRIVQTKNPKEIYDRLSEYVKQQVASHKPLRLDNRVISHLKHMPIPYGTYGTSLIRRLFTTLAYKTKIMTANWIVAERLIIPIRVVKIGTDNRPASPADLAEANQMIAAAANDPNLTIVTHHAFELDFYGASGKILQLSQELEHIDKELLDGLMLNQALLNGEMCLPPDHLVITKSGPRRYDELTEDDEIKIFDAKNNTYRFEKPIKTFKYENVSKLYEFYSGNKILFRCTANHRVRLSVIPSKHDKDGNWVYSDYIADNIDYRAHEMPTLIKNRKGETTDYHYSLITNNGKKEIDSVKEVEYNGNVFCFETSTGYFYVDFNGNQFVTGNSGYQCHDVETEVLTKEGFKKYQDVTEQDEIATFKKETEELEYHPYIAKHEYDYDGELIGIKGKKIDVLVTPNHRMLVRNSRDKKEWKVIEAEKVTSSHQFRSVLKWEGRNAVPTTVRIDDEHEMKLEDYIRLVCYFATEGSVRKETRRERRTFGEPSTTTIYQSPKGKAYSNILTLADTIGYRVRHYAKYDMFCIHNKKLSQHLMDVCGNHSSCKRIPAWIKDLPTKYLRLAIQCLLEGDGYFHKTVKGGWQCGFEVKSKQLANDLYEISFKCGYAPLLALRKNRDLWSVDISDCSRGRYPYVNTEFISRVSYKGKVWCFTVPNGFFVTRRNGKIGIHGNSAQVGVEVLIRRLESFRNTLAEWVEERVFKPIAQMKGLIDKEASEKIGQKVWMYPKFKWDELGLKDNTQMNQLYMQLHDKKVLSTQTLCEKLDLEYDQEVERLRYETASAGAMGAQLGGPGGGMGGLMGGGGGGISAPGGGAAAPPSDMGGMGGAPGGDMGGGMGGAPGGAPAGGGGAMAGAQPMKILKKSKAKSLAEQQEPMQFGEVRFTRIEQEFRQMLDNVYGALNLNTPYYFQYKVENPNGGKPYYLDFAFPDFKLATEVNGSVWHSNPKQVQHDKERDYLLAMRGWTVLRFDDKSIDESPDAVRDVVTTYLKKAASKKHQKKASLNEFDAHYYTKYADRLIDIYHEELPEQLYNILMEDFE